MLPLDTPRVSGLGRRRLAQFDDTDCWRRPALESPHHPFLRILVLDLSWARLDDLLVDEQQEAGKDRFCLSICLHLQS